ncbi:MAG: HI0074 family nucleotidyltransferase substrate-binding subunit [Anaerolineae bacterium]|nr:nucleotidyltransferase substrate binding protein [Thermoflexales bacterium]MDW8395424.1 HI0074 family nucleotidyltransferase substrate-binding subunit [Anaerolineae bacterium]
MTTLSVESLQRAVAALEEALDVYHREQNANASMQTLRLLRDAAIQRFEFTFELAWKTLKRYLERYSLEQVDRLTNRQLFRVGHEQGLLRDSATWLLYLQRRNETSRIYNEAAAVQVFAVIPEFLNDARFLLSRLEERLG